jgi:GTPase SAR1 family protein
MLVGEGRAGKTALANTFMGLTFTHTESTCGMEQSRVEVSHAVLGSSWRPCEAVTSQLDAAIITLAKGATTTTPSSGLENNQQPAGSGSTIDAYGGSINEERFKRHSVTSDKLLHIGNALLSSDALPGSDLLVRLFDFAGQDVFTCLHSYFLTRHGVYVIVFSMS